MYKCRGSAPIYTKVQFSVAEKITGRSVVNGREKAKPLHINYRDGIVKVTEKFNE